ncbi:MAG: peptide chain release factor 2 [Bacteroidota bacterium]|nr:peptide chain release factor 2 [Bacteroidota bacterium]
MAVDQNMLEELKKRIAALRRYLDLDKKLKLITKKEKEAQAPGFWDDSGKAEQKLKETARLKTWTSAYSKLSAEFEDLSVIFEFYEAGEGSEKELDERYGKVKELLKDLEFKNMLRNREDQMGAILKINPGAGGTESTDWAEMLMRMYIRWGEDNDFKVKQVSLQPGDEAGIKSASLEFEGDFAYGYLKGENGVHRLVRLSPFDSSNRRHTSFASVFVAPSIDDDIDIEIDPGDLSWETFRSGGAGGQGVNKLETGVRVRHAPSGISVDNTETRSQRTNKNNALRILRSHLYEIELRKRREKQQEIEGNKKKIEWGSQIRNYVLHPYKLIKDLRTNIERSDVQNVLDGDLNEFIKSYLMEFGKKL